MKARFLKRLLGIFFLLALAYFLVAYAFLPDFWFHRERQSGLGAAPAVTMMPLGIPGDPLNVGLVGDQAELLHAMLAAGWFPADAITLKSSLEIAESVVLDKPYIDAPVSTLEYQGRKQDLAFEKPIGTNARQRHHVRFWKVLEEGAEGRPVWLGAATLDRSVGFSEYTGQITHHIAPAVDAERETLIGGLIAARMIIEIYQMTGVGPAVAGRNGGGDWYYTDGEIKVGVISPGAKVYAEPPEIGEVPPLVQLKDGLWAAASRINPPDDAE